MNFFWRGFEKQAIKIKLDEASLKELESILTRSTERMEKSLGGVSGEAAKKFQAAGSGLLKEHYEALEKIKKIKPGKLLGLAIAAGGGLALGGAIGGAIGSKVSKNTLGETTEPRPTPRRDQPLYRNRYNEGVRRPMFPGFEPEEPMYQNLRTE